MEMFWIRKKHEDDEDEDEESAPEPTELLSDLIEGRLKSFSVPMMLWESPSANDSWAVSAP